MYNMYKLVTLTHSLARVKKLTRQKNSAFDELFFFFHPILILSSQLII